MSTTETLPARPSRNQMQPGQLPAEVATRSEFNAVEEHRAIEISARAMAERERAQIEAMHVMASKYPRKWATIEAELIQFCESPIFADAAVWERPVGSEKNESTGQWEEIIGEGFSIRFCETAAQSMGNLYIASDVTVEMENTRILRSIVADVEKNLMWVMPDSISKYMERRKLRPGDLVVSERTNSRGDIVYIVQAPEDQVRQKMNAALSRTQRNNILRVIPAHVKQHCWEVLQETFQKALTGDERQKTIDKIVKAFDTLGVSVVQIQELLGHTLSAVTDEEVRVLRGARNVIFEKQGTWEDIVKAKKSAEEAKLAKQNADKAEAEKKTEAQPKPADAEQQQKPAEGQLPAETADKIPVEDEPAGANEATPSQGGLLTAGVPVASLSQEEYRTITTGLKALGKAKTRAQVDDFLGRWPTTKQELLSWLEEELRRHEGISRD